MFVYVCTCACICTYLQNLETILQEWSVNPLKTESEPELLYEWRFTANQFVLAQSPLRITTRDFFLQLSICSYSPYESSSLMRGWVCILWTGFAFVKWLYHTYSRCLHVEFHLNNIDSFCTSQETHYVSGRKPNRLMLFREKIFVYCKNHIKHTNALWGKNAEL
jgi:hypothetical protein